MLDHHLQKAIVYQLAFTPQARFSELQPEGVENKLFDYHLKKVMAAGYVAKNDEGLYELTPVGQRLGLEALRSDQTLLDKAYSLLLLVVRRKSDGAWLLYTRQRHPLLGYTGFPQATPRLDSNVMSSAQASFRTKTGLDTTFEVRGNGYLRMFKNSELESFTHFTLLGCEDAKGVLAPNDEHGEYEWVTEPDFSASGMLPSMKLLAGLYEKSGVFFVDETYQL
jgi:hypothetical protein